MDQARWNRVEELLQAALDLAPDAREAYLDRVCGSDVNLRRELAELLAREADGALFESPAIAVFAPHLVPVPLTGQRIGHYRIEARIGAGGMGEVYEARDERLHRAVAIKALSADLTADADRVRRFEQEALAASQLNHPNIVTIFEFLHDGDAHVIVTEKIEGTTLRAMLAQKLDTAQALDIAIQVAAALEAAHTAWIIHRDIKPENIMVRSDGLVKVLDFGIAKLIERPDERIADRAAPSTDGNLTTPGSILGTANYMSPEQSRGERLDGRTDLYSLGLVLREMLPEGVARDVQRIVRKALRADRDERYTSARDMLDDLRRARRRIENRTARRMILISMLVVIAAIAIVAIVTQLSIREVWEERVLRDGHTAAARQVLFSPDGRLLVSCGEDGRVLVWDFARRQRIATFNGAPAMKIAFSPDGRWLASGHADGAITIIDARRWKTVRVLREHSIEVYSLAFSRDSSRMISQADRTILWDTNRWVPVRRWPHGGFHGSMIFSADGRQLFSSNGLVVYDLTSGSYAPAERQITIDWVAVSPDATMAVTADSPGDVAWYRFPKRGDFRDPQLIARIRAHQDHGRAVEFSPNGELVASAAEDVLLWDARTRRKIARFEHNAIVWSLAFSHDGRWLVSSHADGAVLVWDVAERERVANMSEHSGAVRAVAFSRDGNLVASAGEDRSVMLWNVARGTKEAVLARHKTRVASLSFSADGAQLASGDQNGDVVVWDVAKRRPRMVIEAGPELKPAYSVTIAPDGRSVATSQGVHSTADGRRILELRTSGQLYGLSFSKDGRVLAGVTDGGRIFLWDVVQGRLRGERYLPHTHQISVSFSPDGRWIVTGEDEGAVRLWSASPLREVAVLGRHGARVKSVSFSPDGSTVASAGDDKMIALWDVKRRKLRARIGTHASPVYSIAFSADGNRLVSGEHDRTVRIYTRRRTSLWSGGQ